MLGSLLMVFSGCSLSLSLCVCVCVCVSALARVRACVCLDAVGDRVHAVYPGDGKLYPATIAKVISTGYVRTNASLCVLNEVAASALHHETQMPLLSRCPCYFWLLRTSASLVAGDRLGRWHNGTPPAQAE